MDNIKRINISIFERSSTLLGYCTDTFSFTADRVKYEEKPEIELFDDAVRWSRASKRFKNYDKTFGEIKNIAMRNDRVYYDINEASRMFQITIKDNDNKVIKTYDLKCLSDEGKKLYDLIIALVEQFDEPERMNFFFSARTKSGEWR